eukprot:11088399-Alexandrium_andersonii.AAC.1
MPTQSLEVPERVCLNIRWALGVPTCTPPGQGGGNPQTHTRGPRCPSREKWGTAARGATTVCPQTARMRCMTVFSCTGDEDHL